MGTIHYLQAFDRDIVDRLLAMTWPKYLQRYKCFGDQWDSPEQALTDFFLDSDHEDGSLASRIVRSWTLRRTMRCVTPKIYFLEQLLYSTSVAGVTVASDEDGEDVVEEITDFGHHMIDAFFERRLSDAAFRAAMKLVSPVIRYNNREVARTLRNNPPKVLFTGLPPLDDGDRETSLSSTETKWLLQMIETGWKERWLRDCPLAAKLRGVKGGKRPVLVWWAE